ncbi:hypothetical protein [Halorarum salinum]|uniref:DUF8136 domain-containing protein n=1 Tax=Halorarum salinum TaxID=2743089 RepID=A0A7D5QH23_9EURY|nr:hypothetical protein [Halobaculum salinum]QLG62643.1 hypothetical protein HUG12_13280 [Halobaculum salinum]
MDRDEVLALVELALRESARKVESGRVRSPANERVRISWVKATCNAASTWRLLARDEEEADSEPDPFQF